MRLYSHVDTQRCPLLFCGLQDLSMGYEQVLLTSPYLVGFFLHWCIIHGLPRINPACPFIFYGNLHCLALLAIILFCWAFSKIVCVGFMGLLGAIYRPCSNCENDPSLLHLQEGASSTHTPFPLQLQKEPR